MKKILILGGNGLHIELIKTAKKMGLYTIVVDYYEMSIGKEIADEAWKIDVKNIDEIVQKCKERKVDGVISCYFDSCQRPYFEICNKLKLPCYISNQEQLMTLTDKIKFKKFCIENMVDVIPGYEESDIKKDVIEYPVIVKPNDSRGSYGVYFCANKNELISAIPKSKKESSDGHIVIEKYMGFCDDFSMTYFFTNGEAHLIRTLDRYLGKKEDNLNRQCIGAVSPSKHTEKFLDKANEKVVDMLKKLGVTNGPVFMQGFVDGDSFRFYDPGFRFPGSVYETVLEDIYGVNILEYMIDFAITGHMSKFDKKLSEAYKLDGKYCILINPNCKRGQIQKIIGLEEIKEMNETFNILEKRKIGDEIEDSGDVSQRIMEITMLVNDRDNVQKAIKDVFEKLKIIDIENEDMLVSKFSEYIV